MIDCAPPPATDVTPDDAPLPARSHDVVWAHAFARDELMAAGAPRADASARAAELVAAVLLATDHGRRELAPELAAMRKSTFDGSALEHVDAFVARATEGFDDDVVARQERIVRRMVGLTPPPARESDGRCEVLGAHPEAFAPVSGFTYHLRAFVGPQ